MLFPLYYAGVCFLVGLVLCRGLIHQAHLFEYINKLNGFNFSYVGDLFL